jgi:nitroreductase
MGFEKVVAQRYATKLFDGRKVPEEKIGQLLEMVRLSPSGLNLQPWKIRVVTDQVLKETLQPLAFNQQQISTCSHLLIFCAWTDAEALVSRVDRLMKSGGVPDQGREMLVGMSKMFLGGMSPQQVADWAKSQVFLALGNALNGAKSLGLDSCPMSGFDAVECSRVLALPSDFLLTAMCPVGYAADVQPPVKLRVPLSDIVF